MNPRACRGGPWKSERTSVRLDAMLTVEYRIEVS
jgi:hypothetical protein